MSSKQTNRWDKNETKRNVIQIFLFNVLNVDLLIRNNWCEIIDIVFIFFLSNDVSTFQKNEYCKDFLTSTSKKKIDYWLNVDWFRRTKRRLLIKCRKFEQKNRHDWLIDWFDEQKNRQLIVIVANSLFFSKKTSHFDDFLLARVFRRAI